MCIWKKGKKEKMILGPGQLLVHGHVQLGKKKKIK